MKNIPQAAAGTQFPRGVTFNTDAYQRLHTKLPRGRGNWAFCPAHEYSAYDYLDYTVWVAGQATFTEAKKAAALHFAQDGIKYITVCP